jgi:hypothetical protein
LLENIERRLVTSLRTHFQDASVRVGEITLDGSVSASTSTT